MTCLARRNLATPLPLIRESGMATARVYGRSGWDGFPPLSVGSARQHPLTRLEVAPMIVTPPYTRGLVLIRHRLSAPTVARNLVRIAEVHQASARLPQVPSRALQ